MLLHIAARFYSAGTQHVSVPVGSCSERKHVVSTERHCTSVWNNSSHVGNRPLSEV